MQMPNSSEVITLTPGQQMAIEVRDANVLVAAAAGSGKTKVLVDRIVSKVTDKDNPVNVDQFLVVTFTNAAAAQMRDKIRGKLQKALSKNPSDEHLCRQQLLVNRADICTIDSFCLKLVKENFNMLDIDSSFTIGDAGVMEMVKSEVMDNLFEELYDKGDKEFKVLVDIFGLKNNEEELRKAVANVYSKASSYPIPMAWYSNAKSSFDIKSEDVFNNLKWVEYYVNSVKAEIADIRREIDEVEAVCNLPDGPAVYVETLEADRALVERIAEATTYEDLRIALADGWTGLPRMKKGDCDEDIKDKAQKLRNKYKKRVGMLIPTKTYQQVVEEQEHLASYVIPLIKLTERFEEEYMKEKKLRRMFEFSDIAHMAHSLVCSAYDVDGKPIPTELAKNISMGIEEIYIDEYQDSNFLQEEILYCVSGNYRDCPNMFMVGDVKQSIYRFRMARPDLFIGKYDTFKDTGDNVKILLNNNFRSRAEVLLPVNYFFYQLMGKELGGIVYDASASLVPSALFPQPNEEEAPLVSHNTEIMVLNLEDIEDTARPEQEDAEDDMENLANLELEAHMIAGRIKELLDKDNGMLVCEEIEVDGQEQKIYRKASYKDIVILVRSMKGVGEVFYNVLSAHGIPSYLSDPKGYFDAVEVRVVMSLLSVVDNSKQDIPLAAVLMSPMARLDESDIAVICDYTKEKKLQYLYDKCQLYMLEIEDEITKKLKTFFELLENLKDNKNKLSISQLIWEALEVTGYYTYVSAMPMGHRRKANLDMLLDKAEVYENGYYKGLFNFLRYVDKLKVNQVDFGEAAVVNEDEDVVRIMTMHSSKGLEYPIVFVSALGKYFNREDNKKNLIINNDYYLSMKYMNRNKRYSKDTLVREAFKDINISEGLAEELRVLYVALTRAKEKLVITGYVKKYTELMNKCEKLMKHSDMLLPYTNRKKADSFIDLLVQTMARFDRLKDAYEVADKLNIKVFDKSMLAVSTNRSIEDRVQKVERLLEQLESQVNSETTEEILKSFKRDYSYQKITQLKSKLSVSDIKKMKAFDGTGYDDSEFACKALEYEKFQDDSEGEDTQSEKEVAKPTEIQEEQKANSTSGKLTGAMRGTVVHKCMELIDFASLEGETNLYKFAVAHKKALKERGIFDDAELRAINCKKVANMLKSNLGQRMIKAAIRGELFKEQQFSIGFAATKVFDLDDMDDLDDTIIVQGIVDGYFVEDGAIVVMDYKTDACDEDTLIGRYKAQLKYYGDTLSQLRGLPVKEMIMYSFGMEKEVSL